MNSLFLDRDGVINVRPIGDYIKSSDTFQFETRVPEAIALLSNLFSRIIIVTNQQGVGKKLMTESQLKMLHAAMLQDLTNAGARVDGVYYCPHLAADACNCRKPKLGMAFQAKKEFPDIHFKQSIMVGDTLSDMRFAKRLQMKAVLVGPGSDLPKLNPRLIDAYYPDLYSFAMELSNKPGSLDV